MSDNVGLSTPRGSGTSGYVQRNLAYVRPRDRAAPYPPRERDTFQHRQRRPDKNILEHERKRKIEVKVAELQDSLEEENEELKPEEQKTEEEINEACNKLRQELIEKYEKGERDSEQRRQFKGHEVHEMADAKLRDMDRIGKALKIPANYEEGSHWRKQEERMKSALEKDGKDDKER